jgi:hypothetical protein
VRLRPRLNPKPAFSIIGNPISSGANGRQTYNKTEKNEFLAIEDIPHKDDGKLGNDMFVKAYN